MRLIKTRQLLSLLVLLPVLAQAHDTTHIHPMITKRVSDLIKQEDINNAYLELHIEHPELKQRGIYWGKDRDLDTNADLSLPGLLKDNLPLYGSSNPPEKITHYDNVMDGVVQEDVPTGKVADHFYHALTGDPLSLNGVSFGVSTPSSVRAMEYFHKSIAWYGSYTEAAKKRAYFAFGQSLHHVEDMSSPAHIHNDPHLTFLDPEKDDYEDWFLPTEKRFSSTQVLGNKVDEYIRKKTLTIEHNA